MQNGPTLALGAPSLPIAVNWRLDKRHPHPARECCLAQQDHACRALIALRASLWSETNRTASISHVLDRMADEMVERFNGYPYMAREVVVPWFFFGILHAHPREFRLGRVTPRGDFVDVDPGTLGELFSLDDYRGER